MKKHSRKRVMVQLKKIVNGYVQCSSVLSEYLGVTDMSSTNIVENKITLDPSVVKTIEQISENMNTNIDEFEVLSSDLDEDDSSESSSEKSDSEGVSKAHESGRKPIFTKQDEELISDSTGVPIWLLDYARKGKIQSCVIDIINLNQYFFPPQVEDNSLSSSHHVSLKLLSAIVGLLLGKSGSLVKYWTRNGTHLDWYTVDPIYESASLVFPPCGEVLTICNAKRLSVLLEIAEVSINVQLFPEEWQLFIVAILFWLKNMNQPAATESHLHTMVMCLVTMFTIDSKIGVHRNRPTFTKKYKKYLSKLVELRREKKKSSKVCSNSLSKSSNDHVDVKQTFTDSKLNLNEVSHDDCVMMFESVLPYHHLSEQIKVKPKQFCLVTVHAFAQFQSSLFHLMVLNSVLGFPLREPSVSQLYSGTFAYNMFVNLSKRNNISAYIETFFQSAPSLLFLYREVIGLLKGSILGIDLQIRNAKKSTKKRKKLNDLTEDQTKCFTIEENEEEYFDENNIFSTLALNE